MDEAAVLSDNAVHGGQPQPGAFADFLGGEERLEDVLDDRLVHAAAGVADGKHHILAGSGLRVFGAVGLIEGRISRLDGEHTHPLDGVAGVDHEVGKNLIDLGRIDLDGGVPDSRNPDQFDILADEPAQHFKHHGHGIVQIQNLGDNLLFAGKGQQLPGQVGGALGGILDLLQVCIKRQRRICPVQSQSTGS